MIKDEWLNKESGLYKCPYCSKEYSRKGISTHILRQHESPERFKNSGTSGMSWQVSESSKQKCLEKKKEKTGNLKEFDVTCKSCNTVFTVIEYENKFSSKEVYFCNISCANRRVHTDITKAKISDSLTGRHFDYMDKKSYKKYSVFSYCEYCGKVIQNKIQRFCGTHCRGNFQLKERTDFYFYRSKCSFKFNLKDFKEKFDFSLIKKFGWYKAKNKGDNLYGVSRDHIVSVKYGFENNIPSWIISHPANCQLLQHSLNSSKNSKCGITIDELLEKIKCW